jgi:hypothetical protein
MEPTYQIQTRERSLRWRRIMTRLFAIAFLFLCASKAASDWPTIFNDDVPGEIEQAAKGLPNVVRKCRVYGCWSNVVNLIDPQHLWRVEISREAIPVLVNDCKLTELGSSNEVPRQFWTQAPYWWHPPKTGKARYFITPGFSPETIISSEDGHYLMAYDESVEVLYVWRKWSYY